MSFHNSSKSESSSDSSDSWSSTDSIMEILLGGEPTTPERNLKVLEYINKYREEIERNRKELLLNHGWCTGEQEEEDESSEDQFLDLELIDIHTTWEKERERYERMNKERSSAVLKEENKV